MMSHSFHLGLVCRCLFVCLSVFLCHCQMVSSVSVCVHESALLWCCFRDAICTDGFSPNLSVMRLKPITTAIRLRYDDTTMHSTLTEVNEITKFLHSIRLGYDYNTTTTKTWHVHFLLASNGSRRARYVVSQSNRTHIVISITSVVVECVVVSSYHSRMAIVI